MVRTPNWLGDAVMALPATGAVRRAFDGRTLILAAPGLWLWMHRRWRDIEPAPAHGTFPSASGDQ
jgi:hypothetical protein